MNTVASEKVDSIGSTAFLQSESPSNLLQQLKNDMNDITSPDNIIEKENVLFLK